MSYYILLVYNMLKIHLPVVIKRQILKQAIRDNMRSIFLSACALVLAVFVVMPTQAVQIDLGAASQYNAFIKNNFTVAGSDTQGRLAVGGDFVIGGGNDVGYKIESFGMGSGPSLIVGGNVIKNGDGSFNVYEAGPHQSPHAGELVYAGRVINNGIEITSAVNGQVEAQLIKVNKAQLPVNFDNAFAHLNQLSTNLKAATASGVGIKEGWPLVFTPTTIPSDNVYVFDVTQEQINSTGGWSVEGVSIDATVVFNITNDNAIAGKQNWGGNKDSCAQGQVGCVQFSQTNISINGKLLSSNYSEHSYNSDFKQQVLFNFSGATQVNLASDMYGTVLAPNADIKSNPSVIYGQIVGKSWEGNMQINYNPFTPVGSGAAAVPTPASIWLFLLAITLVYVNREVLLTKHDKMVKNPLTT
jgi:choice-of-anchor A domain-containing protein